MKKVWECGNNFEKINDISSKLVYGTVNNSADFTLAIPIYGISKTLKETLYNISQLKKTELNVQILISDNKPDEEVNKIIYMIKEFGLKNVALYLSENSLGQYGNFNRCIELSNTEYVAMLHDDDLLVPNYYELVESILPFMRKHKDVGFLQGKHIFFSKKAKLEITKKIRIFSVTRSYITFLGNSSGGTPSCGTIFKKKAVIDAGGFNDDYPSSGDCFLVIQMLSKGYKYYKCKDVFGYYRIGYNCSIKSEICKRFIVEDRKFQESWAETGLFEKIIFNIFGRYFYSKNIKNKINIFSKYNRDINIYNLDYLKIYRCYSNYGLTNLLYKILLSILKIFITIRTIRIQLPKSIVKSGIKH